MNETEKIGLVILLWMSSRSPEIGASLWPTILFAVGIVLFLGGGVLRKKG
jgi:hypothetical protein